MCYWAILTFCTHRWQYQSPSGMPDSLGCKRTTPYRSQTWSRMQMIHSRNTCKPQVMNRHENRPNTQIYVLAVSHAFMHKHTQELSRQRQMGIQLDRDRRPIAHSSTCVLHCLINRHHQTVHQRTLQQYECTPFSHPSHNSSKASLSPFKHTRQNWKDTETSLHSFKSL